MLRRILMCLGVACFAALPVVAQSYQTSFSDVRFDRAKGPATFHAGVEVDAASGAASLNLPLGPGIGARGLHFRPTLSMRMAPQLGISSAEENAIILPAWGQSDALWGTITLDTLYQRSFGSASFSPGSLDLGPLVSAFDRKPTTYSLPGGGGGRVLGQLPAGMDAPTVQALLGRFGFGAADAVGFVPGAVGRATKVPLVQMGSDGSLIVGLRAAGPSSQLTDEVSADIQRDPSSTYRWDLPRRMVVIQGEIAYEFHYVQHIYMPIPIPYLSVPPKTQLYQGHYAITRIRNKLGESISFTYDGDGIGYTATWSVNPAVRVRVYRETDVAVAPGIPQLMDSRLQVSAATRIRVAYQGLPQPLSSYLLEASNPEGNALIPYLGGGPESPAATRPEGAWVLDRSEFGAAWDPIQPLRVRQEGSGEEIRFSYAAGEATTWGLETIAPTVLSRVTTPTRTIDLGWKPYPFRMNYSPEGWGGMLSSSAPCRPAYAYGVTSVTESDGVQSRAVTHERRTPTSNWGFYQQGTAPPDQWVDPTFYDAITHADGTISVHRFMEPSNAAGTSIQALAFLKTLEREVRYYAPGADWQSDLAVTQPASSTAYKWVVKDRFDVRTAGAPTGNLGQQSVPYPTRTRTWDKESQVLTTEETTDWDTTAFGWKTSHRITTLAAAPSLERDERSLAQQGLGAPAYAAGQGVYRRVDKTFAAKASDWIFARVKTEQTTTVQDGTGFRASEAALPEAQPLLTRTFHASLNRVEALVLSHPAAPTVTTAFSYQGTSGRSGFELQSAYLQSAGLVLSGQMGVSAYGYDANGYLASISRKPEAGITLTSSQVSDELGRSLSQTDLNGVVRTFTRDGAGRLTHIHSSDGGEATSIAYDDTDHRGITVIRGAQTAEYRYNGFGELVLERRRGPDGQWSHRLYGYDAAGRNTGTTIWMAGTGSSREAEWARRNLTRLTSITTTTPGRTVCKVWGLDEDGQAVCLAWQTLPGTTTTTEDPAMYPGQATTYDARGRVIEVRDANGVTVATEYLGPASLPPGGSAFVGPIQKVTTGGTQVKWFEQDAAGRLVRITTPVTRHSSPLKVDTLTVQNLRTEYRYDGADRLKEVKQVDEAGRAQVRTWAYNGLGWLSALVQPESGTTSYGAFTVAGAPTVTSYAGRVVRMTPDWMGRPRSVSADDGSVSQTFAYDTAVGGRGKLARSTDGALATSYAYGGQGGRLSSLTAAVPVQGATQTFTQTFGYDTYGNRTSGSTGHAAWTQGHHLAAGLPSLLKLGTQTVANTPWTSYDPASWALKQIEYGNGTRSAFNYGVDQVRLAQVTHSPAAGGPLAQWAYEYDGVGNLVRETDVLTGAFDQYGYDELDRLISAIVQSPTYGEQLQQFDYDAFGNRTSSTLQRVTAWSGAKGASPATTTASAVVGAPGRQVVNAAFTQGSADLLKNRLPATTSAGLPTGAVYDAQGNLTQVFDKPSTVSPAVISLSYDALGRVRSVSNSTTGLTERYQYTAEGLRTVVEEYRGATLQKTRVHLYNDARQLVSQWEKAPAGALAWTRDLLYLGTREAAEVDAAGMHVTLVDHLGSPRIVTGPTGAKESTQKYLPFGELLEQSGSFKVAKGYTNHERTDSSGLIYMQARFYVPWFGRFASPDPARDQHFEFTQSWNIASYVRNNPIMNTDPTGMLTADGRKEEDEKKADG
ncbi:MAG TPA: hypothetical protein DHV93_05195, partial [Holophagaceae bacterium]|nr:hypothetical protein [Holophagaceae bacterium]